MWDLKCSHQMTRGRVQGVLSPHQWRASFSFQAAGSRVPFGNPGIPNVRLSQRPQDGCGQPLLHRDLHVGGLADRLCHLLIHEYSPSRPSRGHFLLPLPHCPGQWRPLCCWLTVPPAHTSAKAPFPVWSTGHCREKTAIPPGRQGLTTGTAESSSDGFNVTITSRFSLLSGLRPSYQSCFQTCLVILPECLNFLFK